MGGGRLREVVALEEKVDCTEMYFCISFISSLTELTVLEARENLIKYLPV